jgi:hypothetical protein
VEFSVIALFHETKIPKLDMKVQVYFNFSKKKIKNKIKSPSSMRNGRFNTSKCRGKLPKMGVLYTHSPERLGPSPKLPKKKLKKSKNLKNLTAQDYRAAASRRLLVTGWPHAGPILFSLLPPFFLLPPLFFLFLPPLLGTLDNSISLALAHARLA